MTVYSYAQLMTLWINAGGSKALAPIAAAIAEAESGGNSDALNPNDNGGTQSSFGLWQISNGTHTPPSPNWANPSVNASLAVGKWKGAGDSFSPWGTYTSGAYKAFLSGGTTPDPNVPGAPSQFTTQALAASSPSQADCLIPNPLSVIPLVGYSCLLTKSNVRGWIGAGLMAAGGLIMLTGGWQALAGAGIVAGQPSLSDLQSSLPGMLTGGGGGAAGGGSAGGGGAPEPPSGGAPPASGTVADASGTSPEFRATFLE